MAQAKSSLAKKRSVPTKKSSKPTNKVVKPKARVGFLSRFKAKHFPVIVVAVFAIIGVVFGVASFAASVSIATEVESGSVSAPAMKVSDTAASGSSSVQFP